MQANEAVQKWLTETANTSWRIENSGYVTCVDMTPKVEDSENQSMTQKTPKQPKKKKPQQAADVEMVAAVHEEVKQKETQ